MTENIGVILPSDVWLVICRRLNLRDVFALARTHACFKDIATRSCVSVAIFDTTEDYYATVDHDMVISKTLALRMIPAPKAPLTNNQVVTDINETTNTEVQMYPALFTFLSTHGFIKKLFLFDLVIPPSLCPTPTLLGAICQYLPFLQHLQCHRDVLFDSLFDSLQVGATIPTTLNVEKLNVIYDRRQNDPILPPTSVLLLPRIKRIRYYDLVDCKQNSAFFHSYSGSHHAPLLEETGVSDLNQFRQSVIPNMPRVRKVYIAGRGYLYDSLSSYHAYVDMAAKAGMECRLSKWNLQKREDLRSFLQTNKIPLIIHQMSIEVHVSLLQGAAIQRLFFAALHRARVKDLCLQLDFDDSDTNGDYFTLSPWDDDDPVPFLGVDKTSSTLPRPLIDLDHLHDSFDANENVEPNADFSTWSKPPTAPYLDSDGVLISKHIDDNHVGWHIKCEPVTLPHVTRLTIYTGYLPGAKFNLPNLRTLTFLDMNRPALLDSSATDDACIIAPRLQHLSLSPGEGGILQCIPGIVIQSCHSWSALRSLDLSNTSVLYYFIQHDALPLLSYLKVALWPHDNKIILINAALIHWKRLEVVHFSFYNVGSVFAGNKHPSSLHHLHGLQLQLLVLLFQHHPTVKTICDHVAPNWGKHLHLTDLDKTFTTPWYRTRQQQRKQQSSSLPKDNVKQCPKGVYIHASTLAPGDPVIYHRLLTMFPNGDRQEDLRAYSDKDLFQHDFLTNGYVNV